MPIDQYRALRKEARKTLDTIEADLISAYVAGLNTLRDQSGRVDSSSLGTKLEDFLNAAEAELWSATKKGLKCIDAAAVESDPAFPILQSQLIFAYCGLPRDLFQKAIYEAGERGWRGPTDISSFLAVANSYTEAQRNTIKASPYKGLKPSEDTPRVLDIVDPNHKYNLDPAHPIFTSPFVLGNLLDNFQESLGGFTDDYIREHQNIFRDAKKVSTIIPATPQQVRHVAAVR